MLGSSEKNVTTFVTSWVIPSSAAVLSPNAHSRIASTVLIIAFQILEAKCFKIIEAKTAAGIRTVPIAEKVYPFFEYWYNLNDCEYLLSTPEGEHFKYRNYYDSYWSPLMETLGMSHRPHDTRHTCISMLTVAGVSDKVIKKIVGHKGQGVTEIVYTHFEIEELIDAINKI